MNVNDVEKTTGLYHKFDVTRTDGSSGPGGKHEHCRYFVLDLDHDPHAPAAIRAYADSCRADYPALAADLDRTAQTAICGAVLGCLCVKPHECHLPSGHSGKHHCHICGWLWEDAPVNTQAT